MSNFKHEKLTIGELKQYKGFENFTDKEADEYIESMYQYCIIGYQLYKEEKIQQQEKLKQ